jgi:putative SOS response-associated peptidase YedK
VLDIHHRMPFILNKDEIDDWINPKINIQEALPKILNEFDPKWESLIVHKVPNLVSKLVNKTSKNIMTVEDYLKS